MRNTAITQIALVAISIIIIVSFIRPTFANIRDTQDEIYQYADATAKANEFNTLLQQLLARERSFSNDDKHALEIFLPTEIDQLAVMHDIEAMVTRHNGQVLEIKAHEPVLPNTEVEFEDYFDEQVVTAGRFVTQDFDLRFTSDYTSFTSILRALETSAYVVEIERLGFGTVGGAIDQFNPVMSANEIEFGVTIKVYGMAPEEKK